MEQNAMMILIALIRHAKLYRDNKFFISYNQIVQITDVRRNTINPCLKRLEALGKINIERVDYKKGKSQSNTYQLNHDIKEDIKDTFGYTIRYDDKIDVLKILKHFYQDDQLKVMLTKSLYNAL